MYDNAKVADDLRSLQPAGEIFFGLRQLISCCIGIKMQFQLQRRGQHAINYSDQTMITMAVTALN